VIDTGGVVTMHNSNNGYDDDSNSSDSDNGSSHITSETVHHAIVIIQVTASKQARKQTSKYTRNRVKRENPIAYPTILHMDLSD
jgi:hypothetical protein